MERNYLTCQICKATLRDTRLLKHLRNVHGFHKPIMDRMIAECGSIANVTSEDFKRFQPDIVINPKNGKKRTKVKRTLAPEIIAQRVAAKKEKLRQAALMRKIRLQEEQAERERLIDERGKAYYIIWDDISFEKNKVKISTPRIPELLHPIFIEGVIEKMNVIKEEFFQRVHGSKTYKLFFYNSNLIEERSPGWENFKSCIEQGIQYFQYGTPAIPSKIVPSEYSMAEFKTHFKTHISKNPYLKALALLHHKDFPIMSIVETRANVQEHSFIFQAYNNRNKIVMFWENINENRATHIFCTSKTKYPTTFRNIQSFITTPPKVKRHLLHLSEVKIQKLKEELGYLKAINHNDLNDYKRALKTVIK